MKKVNGYFPALFLIAVVDERRLQGIRLKTRIRRVARVGAYSLRGGKSFFPSIIRFPFHLPTTLISEWVFFVGKGEEVLWLLGVTPSSPPPPLPLLDGKLRKGLLCKPHSKKVFPVFHFQVVLPLSKLVPLLLS